VLKAKATNVMRAAASLHRNNAGIQTYQKVQQPVPLKALAVHNRACCVQSRKATHGLAQINARSYSSFQSILKNGLESKPRTRATEEPAITHPNIRGADYFH